MRGYRGEWKREIFRTAERQRSEMDNVRRGDFGGVVVGVAHHGCWVAQKRETRGNAAGAERGNRKLSVRMRERERERGREDLSLAKKDKQ